MVDAVRTPYGRRGGALATWHPVDLLALVLGDLVRRTGIDPGLVGDVVVGCGAQVGAQAGNIARRSALAAGWPEHVPGATVDRQAASGAQAVHWAAQAVMSGVHDLVVAGGVDVMSAVPLGANLAVPSVGKPFGKALAERYRDGGGFLPPGQVAEAVARQWALSRTAMDKWALTSMERAKRRAKAGPYLVPVPLTGRSGKLLKADEALLASWPVAAVKGMAPLFELDGVVTAANMAAEADGASALLVADATTAARLGLAPKARFVSLAEVGGDPALWPVATVEATKGALSRAGLGFADVDRYEVHESSAAAVLAWLACTGVGTALVNPDGGSLAFGSPLGAVGAGMFATAVSGLADGRAGTVALTIAGEGGVATACVLAQPGQK